MATEYAIVGRIRKPHGIRGEVVVELETDAPEAVFASGARVFVGTTSADLPPEGALREARIERARDQGDVWLVKLDAIGDRNEAERWRDRWVWLPEDELPEPDEDEVYLHELIGMHAVLPDGTAAGEVVEHYELPQGLVLELKRPDGSLAMVPYIPEIVQEVDVDARVITIDPPEGLLE